MDFTKSANKYSPKSGKDGHKVEDMYIFVNGEQLNMSLEQIEYGLKEGSILEFFEKEGVKMEGVDEMLDAFRTIMKI